jgi:hypothetical protein
MFLLDLQRSAYVVLLGVCGKARQMLCRCGKPIEPGRQAVGFTTCLVCGDKDARKEIAEKLTRVGPVYNKGPEQFLGSPEATKQVLVEGGSRKHIPIQYSSKLHQQPKRRGRRRIITPPSETTGRGRVVALGWKKGERRYIFENEDLTKLGVGRVVSLRLKPTGE